MTTDLSRYDALLDRVEQVVSDPLRFKLKLQIGEDAYTTLRTQKNLWRVWDVGGVAATGATVAKSSAVASTVFSSTASGGLLSMIGLGTAAATPIGWVITAAVVSGAAYYGVLRVTQGMTAARVDTIPRFINTPIDVLAIALLDLIGTLALRVAAIDGRVVDAERQTIVRHFVDDWGYDSTYVASALGVIEQNIDAARVKELATALARFQAENPDCNASAMQTALVAFLRDVAAADAILDEREELAIEAIEAAFKEESESSLRSISRSLADFSSETGSRIKKAVGHTINRVAKGSTAS